ncbi:MAG: hypothetical protein HFG65_14920 [Hungatella sp.]|nr:hypothetical protein [Hungatella sp.]
MRIIWYLLKCLEGEEADCVKQCQGLAGQVGIEEVICFQYQRMLRYGGSWHLEKRIVLPGYIFLLESKTVCQKERKRENRNAVKLLTRSSLIPCNVSCLKELCAEGNLIGMSFGMIQEGIPVVTQGPLKGREHLIQRINRHKRTAEIEIRLAGRTERIVVGLEIYKKQK